LIEIPSPLDDPEHEATGLLPGSGAVVVHKIDRLARSIEDHEAIRAALRRSGVQLVSVTENIEETASGRLVEGIHALMAEFYSANLSSEIRKGMDQKAKMGGRPTRAPIGYVNVREKIAGKEIAKVVLDPERGSSSAKRSACTRRESIRSRSSRPRCTPRASLSVRREGWCPSLRVEARGDAGQLVLRRRRRVERRSVRGAVQGPHRREPVLPSPGRAPVPRTSPGSASATTTTT
jgi:hypothetical protein